MHQEPDVGFDPGSPGSRPGPKAGAKPLRHPGIPKMFIFGLNTTQKMQQLWLCVRVYIYIYKEKNYIQRRKSEREVGGAVGDWVMGTEGGTWWDEHWVLFYMLANWTPIKNKLKKKRSQEVKKNREDNYI